MPRLQYYRYVPTIDIEIWRRHMLHVQITLPITRYPPPNQWI